MKLNKRIITVLLAASSLMTITAQDPNFHIFLCIGQSNMEGNAQIEQIDRQNVPENFKVFSTVKYNNPPRNQGEWYVAVPPLVRENTGLTPMDYFGRTMVANLPEGYSVGVVPVAIGGCRIEHLDKDFDPADLVNEADWFKNYMLAYDNAPYKRLIECAKEAQKAGVIRGILLHQGESNNGDQQWPAKVKKIYDDILEDLNLDPNSIPLFAGEVVTSAEGGVCGGMNGIINTLPKTLETAHVVSAANLPQKGDGLHFTSHGYRVLGCRYAEAMLNLMGIEDPVIDYEEEKPYTPNPQPSEGDFVFDMTRFVPTIWENGTFDIESGAFHPGLYGFGGWEFAQPIDLSGYKYIVAELSQNEMDGVEFRIFDTASYWEIPYSAKFGGGKLVVAELDGMMKNLNTGIVPLNTAEIYRVGFWGYGGNTTYIKQVFATNNDPYKDASVASLENEAIGFAAVYDMYGRRIAESISDCDLEKGIYICGGKKYLK
ncbi:MAG: hypothetical protein J1E95_04540 [Muribaculaceae bacterium]|nr:hypothetical protein [Muribaculaceae bacterium]